MPQYVVVSVRDPLRFPIPGVTVEIYAAGGMLLYSTLTDKAGFAVFEAKSPAAVFVKVLLPDAFLSGGVLPLTMFGILPMESQGQILIPRVEPAERPQAIAIVARFPYTMRRFAGWQNPLLRQRFFPFRLLMLRRFLRLDFEVYWAAVFANGHEQARLAREQQALENDLDTLAKLKEELTPGRAMGRRMVHEGMRGDIVDTVHDRLQIHGITEKRLRYNYYSYITAGNVKSFQRMVGLTDDGIVGPLTWYYLLCDPQQLKDEAERRRIQGVRDHQTLLLRRMRGDGLEYLIGTSKKHRAGWLAGPHLIRRVTKYMANKELERWSRCNHEELLTECKRVFERQPVPPPAPAAQSDKQQAPSPAVHHAAIRYDPWVRFAVLHLSGLIYKNDHLTLYSPVSLIESLRPTSPDTKDRKKKLPQTIEDEAAKLDLPALDAWCGELRKAAPADNAALQFGKSWDIERGKGPVKLGTLRGLIVKREAEVFQKVIQAADLDTIHAHLAARRPGGAGPAPGGTRFGVNAWRRVVNHTLLRAEECSDQVLPPKVESIKNGWNIEALPKAEPEWTVLGDAKRLGWWRPLLQKHLWPGFLHGVCNELSEQLHWIRGVPHTGGLAANALDVANSGPFSQGVPLTQAEPGSALFWCDWVKSIGDRSNVVVSMGRPGGDHLKSSMRRSKIPMPAPPTDIGVPHAKIIRLRPKGSSISQSIETGMWPVQPTGEKDGRTTGWVIFVGPAKEIEAPSSVDGPPTSAQHYDAVLRAVRHYTGFAPVAVLGDHAAIKGHLKETMEVLDEAQTKTVELIAAWTHEAVVIHLDTVFNRLIVLDTAYPSGVNERTTGSYGNPYVGRIPDKKAKSGDPPRIEQRFLDVDQLVAACEDELRRDIEDPVVPYTGVYEP